MFFLTIKTTKSPRKDGRLWARAVAVKKSRKFGTTLSQQSISVKRPILITGAHASGKTYWLDRLRKESHRVWSSRAHAEPVYMSSIWPVSDWTDGKHFESWWAKRNKDGDDRNWTKLKPTERQRALPLYLGETGAVLFIDDADRLTGKKLEIAKMCIRSAHVFVMAATEEGRLAPALRKDVLALEPQIFRLDSDVAYDYTPQFMWFLVAFFMVIGFPEAAIAIGGLKMLASGRRAAKQA